MTDNQMSTADWGFVALATLPMLLVFVAPAFLDEFSKVPVTFAGVGLGVLLLPIGVLVLRGSQGRRRTRLKLSVALAALPFILLAIPIGMQWAVYFLSKLAGH